MRSLVQEFIVRVMLLIFPNPMAFHALVFGLFLAIVLEVIFWLAILFVLCKGLANIF